MEIFNNAEEQKIKECIKINAINNNINNQKDIIKTKVIYKVEDNLEFFNNWVNLYRNDFIVFNFKNPYLYMSVNKSCPEGNDLEEMFKFMYKFYDENPNLMFGKIYNLSNLGLVSVSDIHTFSKSLTKLKDKTNKQVYSSSIIIKNTIVKTVLDMFLKLYQNTRPIKVVENIKDAKIFIKEEKRKYIENNGLRSIDPNNQGIF